MKKDDSASTPVKAAADGDKGRRRRHKSGTAVTRRYRVEIINENTLERMFSMRFKGIRVLMAALGVLAAIASLILVVMMFTPLGRLLPGRLEYDSRSRYIDMALRIDSMERIVDRNAAYASNIVAILTDSLPEPVKAEAVPASSALVDTLISAGEAEQRFVRQFEREQRFNLSVLSPIAAEGMVFESPSETDTGAGAVSAVYRGSVVATFQADDGFSSVVVQHPGDFISVYNDLDAVYVDRGDKVVAGQRIGHSTSEIGRAHV